MTSQICLDYYDDVMPSLPSDVNDQNRVVYLIYAIFLYAYAIFALVVFLYTRNKVAYSKQKSIFGTITLTTGFVLSVTSNVLREYIGRDRYPCNALAWTFHLPILFLACQPIGVMYYYIYRLRKERLKTQAIKRMFNDDTEAQSQSSFDLTPTQLFTKKKRKTISFCNEVIDLLCVWRYSKDGKIIFGSNDQEYIGKDGKKPVDETTITTHHQHHPTSSTSEEEISHNYKKNLTRSIIEDVGVPLMMMLGFGFIYPISIALRVHFDPLYSSGCDGCRLTYDDFIIRMTGGGVYVPLAVIGLYSMRNEDDPLRVFKEVRFALAWGSIAIVSWFPSLVLSLQGFNDKAIINAIEVVGYCGVIYSYLLSGPVIAAYENFKTNKLKNEGRSAIVLSSTDTASKEFSTKNLPPPSALDLNLILLDPKARNAFLEHSVNEISSENVVFVFKLRAWKSIWDKEKPEKVTKIAIQLFKEYISKDAKNQINIPFKTYSNLEKNLQIYLDPTNTEPNENKPRSAFSKPSKDIFEECEKECVLILEHDALPRFCQSKLFKTEIIEAGILSKVLKS